MQLKAIVVSLFWRIILLTDNISPACRKALAKLLALAKAGKLAVDLYLTEFNFDVVGFRRVYDYVSSTYPTCSVHAETLQYRVTVDRHHKIVIRGPSNPDNLQRVKTNLLSVSETPASMPTLDRTGTQWEFIEEDTQSHMRNVELHGVGRY